MGGERGILGMTPVLVVVRLANFFSFWISPLYQNGCNAHCRGRQRDKVPSGGHVADQRLLKCTRQVPSSCIIKLQNVSENKKIYFTSSFCCLPLRKRVSVIIIVVFPQLWKMCIFKQMFTNHSDFYFSFSKLVFYK